MNAIARRAGFLVAAVALLSGCALLPRPPEMRIKARLYDAFHAYQAGDAKAALEIVQLALADAPRKKLPGYTLVELYDDGALYYHVNGQGRESFIHQGVAVLLSQAIETPENMREFYLSNLGHALEGSGFALELADIRKDPRRLLEIPEVRDNLHVRLYYDRGN